MRPKADSKLKIVFPIFLINQSELLKLHEDELSSIEIYDICRSGADNNHGLYRAYDAKFRELNTEAHYFLTSSVVFTLDNDSGGDSESEFRELIILLIENWSDVKNICVEYLYSKETDVLIEQALMINSLA